MKAVPGINLAASALNAIIAGSIVAAIGEGSIYVFEKVYLGEKSLDDIEWVKKFMESKLSSQFITSVTKILENTAVIKDSKDLPKTIVKLLSNVFGIKNSK